MRVLLNISEEDLNIKLFKLNKMLKMNNNNAEYNSNKISRINKIKN
jgi:hypothetical protein